MAGEIVCTKVVEGKREDIIVNENIEQVKLIATFIRASVESAGQLPFLIKHRNGTEHEIISQLHNLFVLPFGSGKSALASTIPNSHLSLNHTEPAIVGSISKEGTYVPSDLINAANGVYCMDEAHRLNKKAIDAMLSLLEDGHYNRSLGFALRAPVNEGNFKKEGWSVNSKKSLNSIDLKVRFSCIGFCERLTSFMMGAFLSRFVIFNVVLDDEDIFKLMQGKSILDAGRITKKFSRMKNQVIFDCYDNFIDEYKEFVMSRGLNNVFKQYEKGYISRIGAHLAKLSAHFCRMEGKTKVEPKHYRRALIFTPLLVKNLKETKLTPSQYQVYDAYFLRKMKQVEISLDLGVSPEYVSQTVGFLRRNGFIDITKEQEDEIKTLEEGEKNEIEESRRKRLYEKKGKIELEGKGIEIIEEEKQT